MKFTLSWLKDHLDTQATLSEIVAALDAIGLEVEGVTDKAQELAAYRIASVIEATQHPDADRLRVCKVDTGEGDPIQVVCGAPNARTGMKSVFAPPGTYIPGKNITLGVGVIRGVESAGMLCSEAELELSEDHDGIIDLPDDAPVGAFYAAYAKLDDPVIEISLTPNRPDCTAIRGIARDLAAAGLGTLRQEQRKAPESAGQSPGRACAVESARRGASLPELSPLASVVARREENGPARIWICSRCLRRHGLRPINALVDITNYVTHDRGRPSARLRCGEGEGRARGAQGARRRGVARARGQDLYARFRHGGDRRRRTARNRSPGSMGGEHSGLLRGGGREYHGCADRIGPVGSAQYRPDRTQARHHHRCALPFSSAGVRSPITPCRASISQAPDCKSVGLGSSSKQLNPVRSLPHPHSSLLPFPSPRTRSPSLFLPTIGAGTFPLLTPLVFHIFRPGRGG